MRAGSTSHGSRARRARAKAARAASARLDPTRSLRRPKLSMSTTITAPAGASAGCSSIQAASRRRNSPRLSRPVSGSCRVPVGTDDGASIPSGVSASAAHHSLTSRSGPNGVMTFSNRPIQPLADCVEITTRRGALSWMDCRSTLSSPDDSTSGNHSVTDAPTHSSGARPVGPAATSFTNSTRRAGG